MKTREGGEGVTDIDQEVIKNVIPYSCYHKPTNYLLINLYVMVLSGSDLNINSINRLNSDNCYFIITLKFQIPVY